MLFRKQFVLAAMIALVSGCNSGLEEFPVAKVTGVVLCDGSPVPYAKVQFMPMGQAGSKSAVVGKPGFAFAAVDGTFELSTYGTNDGAVIGKHEVTAVPDPENPCGCSSHQALILATVEVVEGKENHFEIKLPPAPQGAKEEVNPFSDPD